MNEWLTPIMWIGGIGAFCGGALALAAYYLSVPEDPRIEQVTNELPGANCGGCGFAGCADYAKALVENKTSPDRCPVASSAAVQAIGALLGKAVVASGRKVALVLCGGCNTEAIRHFSYNGITDCAAAAAIAGGDKACSFGCLGYGSCLRVCPVNCITMVDGVAKIDSSACIGCGKCVAACPRNLIQLVPEEAKIHVLCCSRDKGSVVRKVCGVGCIGCRICVKLSDGAISMDGFLAKVDYTKPPLTNEELVEKCPGKCIRKVG